MNTCHAQVYLSSLQENHPMFAGNPLTRKMNCEGGSMLSSWKETSGELSEKFAHQTVLLPSPPKPWLPCRKNIHLHRLILTFLFFQRKVYISLEQLPGDIFARLLILSNQDQLQGTLAVFVNLVLSGNVPKHIKDTLYGANLCALNKDEGVQPIAVGNTLRRVATTIGQKPIAHGLGNHFRPTQLVFETKGGCEAAVHAAR